MHVSERMSYVYVCISKPEIVNSTGHDCKDTCFLIVRRHDKSDLLKKQEQRL